MHPFFSLRCGPREPHSIALAACLSSNHVGAGCLIEDSSSGFLSSRRVSQCSALPCKHLHDNGPTELDTLDVLQRLPWQGLVLLRVVLDVGSGICPHQAEVVA